MNDQHETCIAWAKPSQGAVDHAAVQVVLRSEGYGVDDEVESAPFLGDGVEHGLEFAGLRDIERRGDRRLQLLSQRLDVGLGLLVEPGHGEIGSEGAQLHRAAVGDRLVVGDADDQSLLALQHLPDRGVRVPDFRKRINRSSGHVELPAVKCARVLAREDDGCMNGKPRACPCAISPQRLGYAAPGGGNAFAPAASSGPRCGQLWGMSAWRRPSLEPHGDVWPGIAGWAGGEALSEVSTAMR